MTIYNSCSRSCRALVKTRALPSFSGPSPRHIIATPSTPLIPHLSSSTSLSNYSRTKHLGARFYSGRLSRKDSQGESENREAEDVNNVASGSYQEQQKQKQQEQKQRSAHAQWYTDIVPAMIPVALLGSAVYVGLQLVQSKLSLEKYLDEANSRIKQLENEVAELLAAQDTQRNSTDTPHPDKAQANAPPPKTSHVSRWWWW